MNYRDKIRQQQYWANISSSVCMWLFLMSVLVAECADSLIPMFVGFCVLVAGLLVTHFVIWAKCPCCSSFPKSSDGNVGNYCNGCGAPFDKRAGQ